MAMVLPLGQDDVPKGCSHDKGWVEGMMGSHGCCHGRKHSGRGGDSHDLDVGGCATVGLVGRSCGKRGSGLCCGRVEFGKGVCGHGVERGVGEEELRVVSGVLPRPAMMLPETCGRGRSISEVEGAGLGVVDDDFSLA